MEFSSDFRNQRDQVVALYRDVFAESEGAKEGALIGNLVAEMIETTPRDDFEVFMALDEGELVGCICFSRLWFDEDERVAFLLSPVAVQTKRHKQGVGQALLRYGLAEIWRRDADLIMTYGDPSYYGKLGFQPVSEDIVPAPLPMTHPEGWLALAKSEGLPAPVLGRSRCAPALNDPVYW